MSCELVWYKALAYGGGAQTCGVNKVAVLGLGKSPLTEFLHLVTVPLGSPFRDIFGKPNWMKSSEGGWYNLIKK